MRTEMHYATLKKELDSVMNGKKRVGGTQPDGWYGNERLVHNYNGQMLIDLEGCVVALSIDDKIDSAGMILASVVRSSHFRHITRVDLDEWEKHWGKEAAMELDILDVSYWYLVPGESEEAYQAADTEWRAEEAQWKLRKNEN